MNPLTSLKVRCMHAELHCPGKLIQLPVCPKMQLNPGGPCDIKTKACDINYIQDREHEKQLQSMPWPLVKTHDCMDTPVPAELYVLELDRLTLNPCNNPARTCTSPDGPCGHRQKFSLQNQCRFKP